jgi:hypothetical protein
MNYGIINTGLKGVMTGGCKGIIVTSGDYFGGMHTELKGVLTSSGDYFGVCYPW